MADYLKQYEEHALASIAENTENRVDFAEDLFNNRSFRKHFKSLTAEEWSKIEEFARAHAIDCLYEGDDE